MASLDVRDGSIRNINIQAILMYGDLIGIDVGVRFEDKGGNPERDPVRPYVGIRLGSYPGITAYVVSAALLAVYVGVYGVGD
jgi:hypothetical protein